VALAVGAFAGCGSGGTTTIIEKTVTAAPKQVSTYLPSPVIEKKYVRPHVYDFAVDGSLLGKNLVWSGWGSRTAQAIGTIEERNWSSERFDDRPDYRGSLVASGLEECEGAAYYTEVIARVPPYAVYVPDKPTQLATPCRSANSIAEEAVGAEQSGSENSQVVRCGNPPNWSGTLAARGLTCGEAALVFERIHCTDQSCTERRSQGWICKAGEGESKYQHVGVCRSGKRFIRWRIYE
jgi:hypothetical protein